MTTDYTPITIRRFWAKVDKTERCWLFRHNNANGYGGFYDGTRSIGAHVFSYVLHYGPVPEDHLVCHTCDRFYALGDLTYRHCVRPDHLYAGTAADNALDRSRRVALARMTTLVCRVFEASGVSDAAIVREALEVELAKRGC